MYFLPPSWPVEVTEWTPKARLWRLDKGAMPEPTALGPDERPGRHRGGCAFYLLRAPPSSHPGVNGK